MRWVGVHGLAFGRVRERLPLFVHVRVLQCAVVHARVCVCMCVCVYVCVPLLVHVLVLQCACVHARVCAPNNHSCILSLSHPSAHSSNAIKQAHC